jgi:hypothetical protein
VAARIKSISQVAREALTNTLVVDTGLCEGDDTIRLCFALQSDFLESMHSSLLGTQLYYVPNRHRDGVHSTLLQTTEAALDGAPGHPAFFTIACYRSSRVVPEPNDSAHAELSQVVGEVGGVEAPSDVKRWTRRTLPSAKIDAEHTPHTGRCQTKGESPNFPWTFDRPTVVRWQQ